MTNQHDQPVSKRQLLIAGGSALSLLIVLLAVMVLNLMQPELRDVSKLAPFSSERGRPLQLQRAGVLVPAPLGVRLTDRVLIAADDERNTGDGQALPAGSVITLVGAFVRQDRLLGSISLVLVGRTQLNNTTLFFTHSWGDADLRTPVNKAPGALNAWRFDSALWQAPGTVQVHRLPNP